MQQCTCLGNYKQHSTASTFEVSGVVVACQRPAKRRASERRGCDWFDVDFETLMFGSPGPVAGSPPSTPHPISLPSSILYLVFSSTMSERNPKCCIKNINALDQIRRGRRCRHESNGQTYSNLFINNSYLVRQCLLQCTIDQSKRSGAVM